VNEVALSDTADVSRWLERAREEDLRDSFCWRCRVRAAVSFHDKCGCGSCLTCACDHNGATAHAEYHRALTSCVEVRADTFAANLGRSRSWPARSMWTPMGTVVDGC